MFAVVSFAFEIIETIPSPAKSDAVIKALIVLPAIGDEDIKPLHLVAPQHTISFVFMVIEPLGGVAFLLISLLSAFQNGEPFTKLPYQ